MRKIVLVLLSLVLLSGCRPYRVDIQQGNIIDANTITRLSLGMSKSEVGDLLGSPVLVDPFDSNIWLYAYTKQINGGKIEKKKLVLRFKQDILVSLQ